MIKVTPFTGVWIEICRASRFASVAMSHPSRVCGLKSGQDLIVPSGRLASHPSRVCGLKFGLFCLTLLEGLRHTLHGCVD